MDRWSLWLFYASLTALAIFLLRFSLRGLYKTYRFLFSYFAGVLVSGLVLAQIPYRTQSYMFAFMTAEVLLHILAIFVVLEVYQIALAGHAGLAEFGRTSFLAATALAFALAAGISLVDRNIPRGQSINVHRFVMFQRSWDLVLVVFLVLIGLFITWFPVKMSKNTALGIAGFSVVFLVRAGIELAANILPPKSLPAINNSAMILETAMMIAWAAAIRPEKTKDQVIQGHFWNPAALDGLSQQLDSINAALARFVRH